MRRDREDDLTRWTNHLRTHGRVLRLGVPLEPPRLPRDRQLRRLLEVEARGDARIRLALDTALAAESKKKRKRRTLVRDFGTITEIY
jgi:hypothetical protein